MGTISEKIFSRAAGTEAKANDFVLADIDYAMAHDGTSVLTVNAFKEMEMNKVWDPSRIIIPFDHIAPANNETSATLQKEIREWVKKQGIPNFYELGKESAIRCFLKMDSLYLENWLWELIRTPAPMELSGLLQQAWELRTWLKFLPQVSSGLRCLRVSGLLLREGLGKGFMQKI